MSNAFTTFLFTITGSFIIWLTKGFKGHFNEEMVSIDERHSTKGNIRYYLGIGAWIFIIVLTGAILARPTQKKAYKIIKTDEKGEAFKLQEIK